MNYISIGTSKLISCVIVSSLIIAVPSQVTFAGNRWSALARFAGEIMTGFAGTVIIDRLNNPNGGTARASQQNQTVSNVENFARRHFSTDDSCNISATMRFYAPQIYYEGSYVNSDNVLRTKQAVCKLYRKDSLLSIREGSMRVSVAKGNNNIKVVDYIVDFDVFSVKQKKRLTGATKVRLVIDSSSSDQLIVGESHKQIS